MKRLPTLFARPLVRVAFLSTLVLLALTLLVVGNRESLTARNDAQPIAASQAAAIIKSGQTIAYEDFVKASAPAPAAEAPKPAAEAPKAEPAKEAAKAEAPKEEAKK